MRLENEIENVIVAAKVLGYQVLSFTDQVQFRLDEKYICITKPNMHASSKYKIVHSVGRNNLYKEYSIVDEAVQRLINLL